MRNRIELGLVMLWAFSLGWDVGGLALDYGGPHDDQCFTALPVEAQLEEGLSQFNGFLGCGALWLTGEPEDFPISENEEADEEFYAGGQWI